MCGGGRRVAYKGRGPALEGRGCQGRNAIALDRRSTHPCFLFFLSFSPHLFLLFRPHLFFFFHFALFFSFPFKRESWLFKAEGGVPRRVGGAMGTSLQ